MRNVNTIMEKEWWKNKISVDIYETFREKEQQLCSYHGHSPQLWARRHLVDWLAIVVEAFGLDSTSQHLAVHLLDYFMDKLEVNRNHLYLLTMACLAIAVKYEERCDKTPGLCSLNRLLPGHHLLENNPGYTPAEMLNMEITVLNYFDWSLSLPTVAQFLPYFLVVAVDETDLINGHSLASKSAVYACLESHAKYFQEICLQDHVFRDYLPSLVAASCIAASRITLKLTPTWPKQLELMTEYFLEELLPCINHMLRHHKADKHLSQCNSALTMCNSVPTECSPSSIVHHYNPVQMVPTQYTTLTTSAFCQPNNSSYYPVIYGEQPFSYPSNQSQLSMCRGS